MITKPFKQMAEVYKVFAKDWKHVCNFGPVSLDQAFKAETYGREHKRSYSKKMGNGRLNGFLVGKHWMDVTLAQWKEDIPQGMLFKYELYREGQFPSWWLDKVLEPIIPGRSFIYES